ncbi:hypothetical protein ES703_58527 [subsurface metagenome]
MPLGQYGSESLREFLRELFGVASPNNLENITINQLLGNKADDNEAETLFGRLADVYLNDHHATRIFPEASNLDVVFTSGGGADTWGAWAEIVDTAAATLTSRFTLDGHITGITPEECSKIDQVYMLEIAYGAVPTTVARLRVESGAQIKLPAIAQKRIRCRHIPAGETVYYRMMDETGGSTMNVAIRYFLH